MTKEQEPITWIVGKDNCQVAVRNIPIDKMQKICAIIEEEGQQLCADCVSRQKLKEQMIRYGFHAPDMTVTEFVEDLPFVAPRNNLAKTSQDCISRTYIESIVEELENIFINGDEYILSLLSNIKNAPAVTPKLQEWLSSFNTESATECFTAVQELKKEIENGHIGKE